MDAYDVLPRRLPHSVFYVRDFISEDEAALITHRVENVNAARWKRLHGRSLQMYGGTPPTPARPRQRFIKETMPAWLQAHVLDKIERFVAEEANHDNNECDHLCSRVRGLNHVLVNAYEADGGIEPHEDGPVYDSLAVILSLGDTAKMSFAPTTEHARNHSAAGNAHDDCRGGDGNGGGDGRGGDSSTTCTSMSDPDAFSVVLEPRSLLLFTGAAYTEFTHGIDARREHGGLRSAANWDRVDERSINEPAATTGERGRLRWRGGLCPRPDTPAHWSPALAHVPARER